MAGLESCLLVMLAIVGTEWENVEYIKTLVCALLTWQRWHSRTRGCIHKEEYGEAMLSTLCAQCQVWSTKTSLSGALEVFITLAHTQRGRKHLRFSLTDKCVQRYGSNLRKFIFNVSVGNLPIVQWQTPTFRVVEAVHCLVGSYIRESEHICEKQQIGSFVMVQPQTLRKNRGINYMKDLLQLL